MTIRVCPCDRFQSLVVLCSTEKSYDTRGKKFDLFIAQGTVKRGTVNKGDSAEVMGFGFRSKTSVSGLQVFKKNVQAVGAGENVGINIKGVKADQLEKGMVLAAPNSIKPTNHFEVSTKPHLVPVFGKEYG